MNFKKYLNKNTFTNIGVSILGITIVFGFCFVLFYGILGVIAESGSNKENFNQFLDGQIYEQPKIQEGLVKVNENEYTFKNREQKRNFCKNPFKIITRLNKENIQINFRQGEKTVQIPDSKGSISLIEMNESINTYCTYKTKIYLYFSEFTIQNETKTPPKWESIDFL